MDSPWRAPAYGEQLERIAELLEQVIRELRYNRAVLEMIVNGRRDA